MPLRQFSPCNAGAIHRRHWGVSGQGPFYPQQQTSSARRSMPVSCQTQTWRVEVAQKKKPPEGGSKFAKADLEIQAAVNNACHCNWKTCFKKALTSSWDLFAAASW